MCFISDVYNTAALRTEAFMIEVDARQMSESERVVREVEYELRGR